MDTPALEMDPFGVEWRGRAFLSGCLEVVLEGPMCGILPLKVSYISAVVLVGHCTHGEGHAWPGVLRLMCPGVLYLSDPPGTPGSSTELQSLWRRDVHATHKIPS